MESLRVPTARHKAAGELVNYDHLAILHHVVPVLHEHHESLESVLHIVSQHIVAGIVQVAHVQPPLHFGDAFLGEHHRALLLVQLVVLLWGEPGHRLGEGGIQLGGLLGSAADD